MPIHVEDAEGPVSQGTLSNPVFATPTRVGDTAWVTLAPPDGYAHDDYVIPGVPHTAMALSYSDLATASENTPLSIGRFDSPVTVWFKVTSACSPAPKLILPTDGFYETTETVRGTVNAPVGIAGVVLSVLRASGTVSSDAAVHGSAGAVYTASGVSLTSVAATGAFAIAGAPPSAEGILVVPCVLIGDVCRITTANGTIAVPAQLIGQVGAVRPAAGVVVTPTAPAGTVSVYSPGFVETWDTLSSAVWSESQGCPEEGDCSGDAYVSGGNLYLSLTERSDYGGAVQVVSVSTFDLAGKTVTFNDCPPPSDLPTWVIGFTQSAPGFETSGIIDFLPIDSFVIYRSGSVYVVRDGDAAGTVSLTSQRSALQFVFSGANVTVKWGGTSVYTGAHGLSDMNCRLIIRMQNPPYGTSIMWFGDVTVV